MNHWPAILALLFAIASPAEADLTAHLRTTKINEYQVTYWTSEQGLPQNTVTCIIQTRDGYLWFGTRHGLVRFDGMRFQCFTRGLPGADEGEMDVRGLAEDSEGRLWFHGGAGLVSYHSGLFQLHPIPHPLVQGTIQSIVAGSNGAVWVAMRRGLLLYRNGKIERAWDLRNGLGWNRMDDHFGLNCVSKDVAERIWVKASDQYGIGWRRLDPRTGNIEDATNLLGIAAKDISAILADRRGRLWLARPHELLCQENDRWIRFPVTNAWKGDKVKQLAEDRDGRIWAVSEGRHQLHRFNLGQFTSYGADAGISSVEDLRCLWTDLEGNIWVGSGSGGLNRLQWRPMVSMLTGSYTTMDEVYSVSSGRDGHVWMATSYGLVEFHKGAFKIFTNSVTRHSSDNIPRVRPVLVDKAGVVWAGWDEKGLQKLINGYLTPSPVPALQGQGKRIITSLFQDQRGVLWIGTPRGLMEYGDQTNRLWTTKEGLSDNSIFGLAEGQDGSLWIGTQQGGINCIKDGRVRVFTANEGLLSQNAWPLRTEPDGSVWVGTHAGLNRIRSGKISSVTVRDGLFDDLAYCLLEDARGNYWTFGNRGIWRVAKTELHAVADGRAARAFCVNYGESDGMASLEGNGDWQPNAVALPNGEFWFPTTRGVVRLDPEKLRDNTVKPVPVIEEVLVDEETLFKDGAYIAAAQNPRSSHGTNRFPAPSLSSKDIPFLQLAPGRARVLEIRYTASTFVDPEKAKFRFQLEGYDRDWREADARRSVLYTQLPPGKYCFRVKACNLHGYWSEVPASFSFQLAAHFYQTRFFWFLCATVVLAGMGGWHLHRLRNLRRMNNLMQQQMLEAERSRIAKDLHDDLGANLTGLALQMDIARQRSNDPDKLPQYLETLAQTTRSMVDRMRDVVWTVNPQCDTLESFSSYLCGYAETYLASAGLRCRLDVPEEFPNRLLSTEVRHHLLMMAKEALNNVAKHAFASEVRLTLSVQDNLLEMIITDNGRGFPTTTENSKSESASTPAASTGHGLQNMKNRARILNGHLDISSRIGLGAQVKIQISLPTEFKTTTMYNA